MSAPLSQLIELKLTRREAELILFFADHWHMQNKELAQQFNLSESSIKHHFSNIHRKLGFTDDLMGSYEKRMRLVRWLWELPKPEAPAPHGHPQ